MFTRPLALTHCSALKTSCQPFIVLLKGFSIFICQKLYVFSPRLSLKFCILEFKSFFVIYDTSALLKFESSASCAVDYLYFSALTDEVPDPAVTRRDASRVCSSRMGDVWIKPH